MKWAPNLKQTEALLDVWK